MTFSFGAERLLKDTNLKAILRGYRVALLGHPASVTAELQHTVDALVESGYEITVMFGPQHGLRGDKQDNMVESGHERDPVHDLPVYSLYGEVRRPTHAMMGEFDILLIDLQDVGCRIYTFLTTLFYLLEDCSAAGKSVWILDRPNPAGRPIEGLTLIPGQESFVGGAAIPMRHGLTLGEAATWYSEHRQLNLDLNVVAMAGYQIDCAPGFGWPSGYSWVNPSPNLATPNSARTYPGTVILEGTTLSEGRGTTRPLECLGAPDLPVTELLEQMRESAPHWLDGCSIRSCHFEPTFQKYAGERCAGIHIHADNDHYDHQAFKPFRLVVLLLKCLRRLRPEYEIWRDFPYEYEQGRLPIDVINGGPQLREWVDDAQATPGDLETLLQRDESEWQQIAANYYRY